MKRKALVLSALLATGGCAQTLDSAFSSAGDVVGRAVGEQVGNAIVRHYTPMFRQWYASLLFNMAFGAGGYYVQGDAYEPGEWTRWEDADSDAWLERAYLGQEDDGDQWWRIKYYDSESEDTIVLEALLSPDLGEMKRLRAKWPDRKEVEEMPLDEETWYAAPSQIGDESLEGATVGTETIEVPAGSFEARHVRFGTEEDGTWQWWMNEDVPGGVVKHLHTAPKGGDAEDEEVPEGAEGLDGDQYTLELSKYGEGAESELGSM